MDDVDIIKQIHHTKLAGVDLNSKFELKPGLKDTALLEVFVKGVKN